MHQFCWAHLSRLFVRFSERRDPEVAAVGQVQSSLTARGPQDRICSRHEAPGGNHAPPTPSDVGPPIGVNYNSTAAPAERRSASLAWLSGRSAERSAKIAAGVT
jgi:hypothetical protein